MKKDLKIDNMPSIKKILIWNNSDEKLEPILTVKGDELAMINIRGNENPVSILAYSNNTQKSEYFIDCIDIVLFSKKLSEKKFNILNGDFGVFRLELEFEDSLNEIHKLAPETLNYDWKSCTHVAIRDMFVLINIDTSDIEKKIKKRY